VQCRPGGKLNSLAPTQQLSSCGVQDTQPAKWEHPNASIYKPVPKLLVYERSGRISVS
jgi:hypothetical protein